MTDQGTSAPDGSASGVVKEPVMGLLADHVPLTLLVDLADAPESSELLAAEGLPAEPWWESTE